jgi:hypothetical protein
LAVGAAVVKEFGFCWVISSGLSHVHAQCTHADRALQESLTLEFLRLRLIWIEHIVTEFAIEIVDFFLEAESAERLGALQASVHFLKHELTSTATVVVHKGSSELCESVHLDLLN